jgi:hypothetical protein
VLELLALCISFLLTLFPDTMDEGTGTYKDQSDKNIDNNKNRFHQSTGLKI